MPKKPLDIEKLANLRTNCGPFIEHMLEKGMSYELIAVKCGEHLSGMNPSVQSIARWKKGTSIPTRAHGAALLRTYESLFEKGEE
jgi:hypothetical protein|tara:strand:- start:2591 stop:2845 length:255 start_codon:yes stop_codon:yes gene_type:complete